MPVFWPNGSLSMPTPTSEFNAARKNPVTGIVQPHNGIDLVGWADVCSPVDGTVTFAGYNGGAGNEVRIRADGPTAFHVGDVFRLMHHARLYVRTGDRVTARQPVGRMGTTGNSTGVHCHFETHEFRLGNPINPRDFMRRANASPASGGGGIEIVMDKETFIAYLWEFFKYRSRDGGNEGTWEKGPTIFERLNGALDSLGKLAKLVNPTDESTDAKTGAGGWFPFRNAMSRWLIYHSRIDGPDGKGATIHERLNQLDGKLDKLVTAVSAIPGDTVRISLDAATLATALADPKVGAALAGPIAKAVNDDAAKRMVS
ncbi:M23 family metallopeptidase [Microbacterium sp. 3J1]|uniref:M23 family metallopeptidase n=1 Tax=Microbacterium sp. 3J1 TaxID=861269 RepID=UPI000B0C2D59|nr:M23 family metallopeptidase [Microbacterium sp. 3J1]